MDNRHRFSSDPQRLEKFVAELARAQPLRHAPATLESRVLQQLALRAARPWWLQGFSSWPALARLAFLPLAAGFVELAFLASSRASLLWQSLQHSTALTTAQSQVQVLDGLLRTGAMLAGLATHGLAATGIYVAAAFALLLYAAPFGLGAAAFRTLFLPPDPLRY